MVGGLLRRFGLRKHRPVVEREGRVGAEHRHARKARRDFDGLRLGKRIGNIERRLACGEERSGERLLVDMRGAGFEGKPGGAENRGAAAAFRSEEQWHSPARYSTSFISAAQVYRIERAL